MSGEEVERIDTGRLDLESARDLRQRSERQDRLKDQDDEQQDLKIPVRGVRRDHTVERQQEIETDEQIQIPQMRPAGAGKELINPVRQEHEGKALPVHEHIKQVESHTTDE